MPGHPDHPVRLAVLVEYQDGAIVSNTLVKKPQEEYGEEDGTRGCWKRLLRRQSCQSQPRSRVQESACDDRSRGSSTAPQVRLMT